MDVETISGTATNAVPFSICTNKSSFRTMHDKLSVDGKTAIQKEGLL